MQFPALKGEMSVWISCVRNALLPNLSLNTFSYGGKPRAISRCMGIRMGELDLELRSSCEDMTKSTSFLVEGSFTG